MRNWPDSHLASGPLSFVYVEDSGVEIVWKKNNYNQRVVAQSVIHTLSSH